MLRSAPVALTPAPFKVSASAAVVILPWICNSPPEDTLVPPAVEPSAFAFRIFSTPALTIVAPLEVFAPESINFPPLTVVAPL